MSAAWHEIWNGLTTASPLDQANLVLGVVGVWLMIRRSLLAFPVGLAAVVVQGVLFYQSRYYADATLQVVFFGALAYGWWHWVRDKGAAPELPVTRLTPRGLFMTMLLAGAGTVVWALVLRKYTDAIMPFRDAFIAAFSVAAQVLQSRKQIENWPFWVVVNTVAVASYWIGGLYYTTFLYALYLVMAFGGWRAWGRAMKGIAA
ncbi:MAG TPA: nicotinamide riboside transporter PnuC [Candidatus Didemnitutus sp.]|nr:nicotinamide riboside transporter PnuC [Candidatus Didemnitutus sp.]